MNNKITINDSLQWEVFNEVGKFSKSYFFNFWNYTGTEFGVNAQEIADGCKSLISKKKYAMSKMRELGMNDFAGELEDDIYNLTQQFYEAEMELISEAQWKLKVRLHNAEQANVYAIREERDAIIRDDVADEGKEEEVENDN